MFEREPHAYHEYRATATQHLVVSQHNTRTTSLFTGHVRMNKPHTGPFGKLNNAGT